MNGIIDAAFSRARVVVMALLMILACGAYAYVTIPKESSPEIPIPIFYVSTALDGISPQDAERLLIEPLETELSSITGLKQMTSNAGEGYASVQLEFEPGFDAEAALDKVKEGVDRAQSDLPDDATDPVVTEINTALFPILTVILSGPVPERTLNSLSDDLSDRIEALSGRSWRWMWAASATELLEVLIDPTVFETYNISFEELIGQINRNNQLIAAGAIENGAGRIVLKVPGLIEGIEDVMALPVKVRGDTVVTFGDVATIRRTFEDPTGFARIDGQPALALEIKKRSGANIIETVAAVRAVIDEAQADWPDTRADRLYAGRKRAGENHAQRSGGKCDCRRDPGDDRDRLGAWHPVGAAGWAGHSGGVSGGCDSTFVDGLHDEPCRAVLADPRGGDAGGRRHRDYRTGRPAAARRRYAQSGLYLCRQAHGLADHRIDRDHAVGVLSAAVLDRHGG